MGSCSAHELPSDIRDAIITKLSPYPQLEFVKKFIQTQENHNLNPFFNYIEKYDQAAGQSYANDHPEFWSVLRK
jgi:hypothetical protein